MSFVYTGKRLINPELVASVDMSERWDLGPNKGRLLALTLTMADGGMIELTVAESIQFLNRSVGRASWAEGEKEEWIGRLQG